MERRTVHRQGLQAQSGSASTPRLAALPEHCRKTRLQRNALTHQPGFYSFSTRVRSGRAGNKETHVPGGAPRAASRALRWLGGPQKPLPARPVAPRPVPPSPATHPAESTLQEAPGASCPSAASSFQCQGPRLLSVRRPCRGSPQSGRPERRRRARGEARPAAGQGVSPHVLRPAWAHPSRPGLRVPAFPAERRRRTRSPRGRPGGGSGRGPGRSPGAGGVLGGGAGGGAGGRPAPRGRRPPGRPAPPPPRLRTGVLPLHCPRSPRSPPAAFPLPPLPRRAPLPRPAQSPPAAAAPFVWAAGSDQWHCADTRAVRLWANGLVGRAAWGGAGPRVFVRGRAASGGPAPGAQT